MCVYVRACGCVCLHPCVFCRKGCTSLVYLLLGLVRYIRITFNYFILVFLTCQTSNEHALSAL